MAAWRTMCTCRSTTAACRWLRTSSLRSATGGPAWQRRLQLPLRRRRAAAAGAPRRLQLLRLLPCPAWAQQVWACCAAALVRCVNTASAASANTNVLLLSHHPQQHTAHTGMQQAVTRAAAQDIALRGGAAAQESINALAAAAVVAAELGPEVRERGQRVHTACGNMRVVLPPACCIHVRRRCAGDCGRAVSRGRGAAGVRALPLGPRVRRLVRR